jgi:hypothetical protein
VSEREREREREMRVRVFREREIQGGVEHKTTNELRRQGVARCVSSVYL